MRDENGFKMHTQSESHVRQILLISEDARKHINDYSGQFQRDFLQLLRTSHGEKKININHFYQEYIHDKEHIHMNATRWPSLTEFAKYLGREGICRVEEGDKGLEVAWIDNSPEALRRQDAIRKKERQDRGDEEREQKLIKEQIERARRDAEEKDKDEGTENVGSLQREEGEKIKLSFGTKAQTVKQTASLTAMAEEENKDEVKDLLEEADLPGVISSTPAEPALEKNLPKWGSNQKPKNVFAAASKKNALGGTKSLAKVVRQKPVSEAERIMKEELDRKQSRQTNGFPGVGSKRQRTS